MDGLYSDDIIERVNNLYLLAILIWIIIIIFLELYYTDIIGGFILLIPIIIFIISMTSFKNCHIEMEAEIFQYDILAFGVVIVTIFLALKYVNYTTFFYKLIFVGILLLGISMIDVWLSPNDLIIAKHIRGILQTMSTAIFIYIFYTFYFISHHLVGHTRNPFMELC